jgi:hypothetical protein
MGKSQLVPTRLSQIRFEIWIDNFALRLVFGGDVRRAVGAGGSVIIEL